MASWLRFHEGGRYQIEHETSRLPSPGERKDRLIFSIPATDAATLYGNTSSSRLAAIGFVATTQFDGITIIFS